MLKGTFIITPETTIEEGAAYLTKCMKTSELIKRLAETGIDWSQKAINKAVEETDTFDFSIDDVTYQRILLNNNVYRFLMDHTNDLAKHMVEIENPDIRTEYYNKCIKPVHDMMHDYDKAAKELTLGRKFHM